MKRLIGVYDYTVILTFISLFCAILGTAMAVAGNGDGAVGCLALAGLCDAFDGRVARSKKNRTEDEKSYGIQMDSLCDVISFGFFPALLCYQLCGQSKAGLVICFFFSACAVIRLAFFNVLEAKRQQQEDGCNKTYRGLPVTSIALIFPLVYCLRALIPLKIFSIVLHAVLGTTGFLFILDFPLPKPGLKTILSMAAAVGIIFGLFLIFR